MRCLAPPVPIASFSGHGNKAAAPRISLTATPSLERGDTDHRAPCAHRRRQMFNMTRRGVLASAGLAAAWGLTKPLSFVGEARAETPLEPTVGFYKYKVGSIEVTAVYDGIWRKPHDPTFIKDVSVDE